jgi:hypothetical protein
LHDVQPYALIAPSNLQMRDLPVKRMSQNNFPYAIAGPWDFQVCSEQVRVVLEMLEGRHTGELHGP